MSKRRKNPPTKRQTQKPALTQAKDVSSDAVNTAKAAEDSAKMAPLPDEIETEIKQNLADESEKKDEATTNEDEANLKEDLQKSSKDYVEIPEGLELVSITTEKAQYIPGKFWFGNIHIKGIGVVNGQVREDHLKEFKRQHEAGQAASGLKKQDQIELDIDYWVRPTDELARKRRNDRKVKE